MSIFVCLMFGIFTFYRQPFLDPSQLKLCQLMEENYDTILSEYEALVADQDGRERFQSVTSLNYESGWKTLVLFENGHRIPKFPYHLCPTTTRILETVPIGGRIAGFNRQQPQSGIPLHSDGNNMWLTCQMGLYVPKGTYIIFSSLLFVFFACDKIIWIMKPE